MKKLDQPAQDKQVQTPQQASQPATSGFIYIGPYQAIENAASVVKPGDLDSIRGVVEAIFKFPRMYRMPDIMAAVVKQRLIDAQAAYFDGKTAGIVDGAVAAVPTKSSSGNRTENGRPRNMGKTAV